MVYDISLKKVDAYAVPMDEKVPNVRVGDIPIPAQNFVWSYISGVDPYTTTFWVPKDLSDKIAALPNPVSIKIEYPTFSSNKTTEPSILNLDNIYLVRPAILDMAKTTVWTIADARWLLQGKKIYAYYNKTLLKNENLTAYAGTDSPADLRRYFETLSQGRYAFWSIKSDGKPYSMKEIIERELGLLGIRVWSGAISDLSYTIDNIIYSGIDAAKVIQEMLRLSRLGMSVNSQGQLYLYSIVSYENNVKHPIASLSPAKVLDGIIYAQDKKRGRPKNVRVLFEKKIETLIVAQTETRPTPVAEGSGQSSTAVYLSPLTPVLPNGMSWWLQADVKNRSVISCINVLPVPYSVVVDGVARNPGEWVPINYYLRAFNLTESFMVGPWFNGGFELRFALHMQKNYFKVTLLSGDQVKQVYRIAATIKAHWRKTYMIDPFFIDQIKKWEPRLCTVINNYDHHHSPAPVFADYFYIPIRRNPSAISAPAWSTDSFSWQVVQDDPYLFEPVPAQCSVVNGKLGVFQVTFSAPLDPAVSLTGNFAISPVPISSPKEATFLLDQAYPIATHTMITMFSFVWERNPSKNIFIISPESQGQEASPEQMQRASLDRNSGDAIRSQYHEIVIADELGGTFPDWEIVSNLEYARFAFAQRTLTPPSLVKWFGAGYALWLKALSSQNKPFNESFLSAIARYESSKIYNQFRDLYAGSITVVGLRNDLILCGNLSQLSFSMTPEGCATSATFLDVMPFPSLEAGLPQKYIDFLRRAVARNDDISYAHTAE